MLKKNKKRLIFLVLFNFFFLSIFLLNNFTNNNEPVEIFDSNFPVFKKVNFSTTTLKLLFVGDIFLDRGVDELAQKSPLKYAYPFQGLHTLDREKYDAWIGNLECPVTGRQSTKRQKETELRFSCKKEYLTELKKHFDIVSLANNHTDNMGVSGFQETKKHLADNNIHFFGHYDNSVTDEICKVIEIVDQESKQKIPVAFCGFHGVYRLPTEKELEVIRNYSNKHITVVLPHQGEEYKFQANNHQKKVYRKIIDLGADLIIGAHPHVIQNIEEYKGKKIYYSLGNFIFDQRWIKTREHLVVDVEIEIVGEVTLDKKPKYTMKFQEIRTYAGLDFVTKKVP